MARFTISKTAATGDIDILGHVNNAVWVQWIQDVAVAHWHAIAAPEHDAAYIWVITRHEIDYRGSVLEGETVTAETWVQEPPRGARFNRYMKFTGADGSRGYRANWPSSSSKNPSHCSSARSRSR